MMLHSIKLFLSVSIKDKLIALETVFLLSFFQILILFFSSKQIARYLGETNLADRLPLAEAQHAEVIEVIQAVIRINQKLPWYSRCLVRALTARVMLKRRKIPTVLFLGLKIDQEAKGLKAHAWLKCENTIVIGGGEAPNYKVIASFP